MTPSGTIFIPILSVISDAVVCSSDFRDLIGTDTFSSKKQTILSET
jgi:hypothetical protein